MGEEKKDDLALRLRRADSRTLVSLILSEGRRLTLREVRQILLNPFVNREAIEELLVMRTLLSIYEVRAALARHPRTPRTAALRFVPGLYWRDLLEIGLDVKVTPTVRRAADTYLLRRLPGLAVGERIAIARRAGVAVLERLRADASPRVITALLENPRLTEEIILPMAASVKATPRALNLVAASPRWGRRYNLRVALSRNPQTPFQDLFEILPTLQSRDLEAVIEVAEHASIVHHRAATLLAERNSASEAYTFDHLRDQPLELWINADLPTDPETDGEPRPRNPATDPEP